MKTAVSLPDELFAQAETEAKKLGVSRSEFYARAIADFMRLNRASNVTEQLNRVYEKTSTELDPAIARMQFLSLPKEEW